MQAALPAGSVTAAATKDSVQQWPAAADSAAGEPPPPCAAAETVETETGAPL